MPVNTHPVAIVWDYDGTLVDTRRKNLRVTQQIVATVTGRGADEFPALRSLAGYQAATVRATNWRDLYQLEFGFSESQTDRAGAMWTELQLGDDTEAPLLPGVAETLGALDIAPHGIVSQNSSENIRRRLEGQAFWSLFSCVVGYQEVDSARQKPDPEGLLLCIEQLGNGSDSGHAVYIGDHEADTRCAANANLVLRQRGSGLHVISIAACYGGETDTAAWDIRPDFTARRAADIVTIIAGAGR